MAKIIIDDTEYEAPSDYDMGEARIIKRYAGITLNQLAKHDPSDPDLIAAFIHITFKRLSPDQSFAQIEERVDAVKLAKIDMRKEDDARPPELPTSLPEGSALSSGASSSNGAESIPELGSLETSGHPV